MTQHLGYGVLLGAALLLASPARVCSEPDIAVRHRVAVEAARAGDFSAALTQLRALRKQAPDDPRLLYDEALVLLWSGQAPLALERVETVPPRTLPTYLLEPLAPAARDAGRPDLAAGYYAALLHREPVAPTPYLAAAMVEAERGFPQAALVRLGAVGGRWADHFDYWMALGYVRGLAGDAHGAVTAYRHAVRLDPQSKDAQRGLIVRLRQAGQPKTALQLAERWQVPLDADLRRGLEHDVVVGLIRRSEDPDVPLAQQLAARQQALSALGAGAPGILPPLALGESQGQRRAFDLLIALRDARRAADVVTVHTQIEAAGIDQPPYVLAAAADAYLMLRQPREAEALYRRIGLLEPTNYQARVGLFYALVEQNRFGEALAVIDAAERDAERAAAGEPAAPPAGPLTDTRVTAAMGRAYADKLPAAQRRLEALPEQNSTTVATARGTIYRWRGWPRRALESYEQALASAPQAVDPALGRIGALLDLDRDAQAQTELAALATTHGDHPAVQAAQRDLALRQRPELTLDIGRSRSSGSTFGSRDLSIRSTGYGSPITAHLRPLLTALRQSALFPEGWGLIERAGAGLDYRRNGWQARLDLTASWRDNDRAGVGLQLSRWLDDHVWLGGTAEYNSADVPLRGQHAGVRGNRLQLATRYRFDERRRLGLSYDLGDYNDNNRRQAVTAFAEQRLLTTPSYRLDGRAEIYGSRNRETDVFYYSPHRDFAANVTLNNHWRTWRRYEKSFAQRFSLTGGTYHSTGRGTAGIWSVGYGHDWRLGPKLSLGYGISHGRHVYDGTAERDTRLMLTLDMRF